MLYPPNTPIGLPDPDLSPEFYEGVVAKRLVAWLVDTALIGLLVGLFVIFTAFLGLLVLPLIWFVADLVYRVTSLSSRSATPGMRLMGIELRDRTGQRLDTSHAFLHVLGYFLSMSVFPAQIVSIVLMLSSSRNQGLTDHLLGTAALRRPAEVV